MATHYLLAAALLLSAIELLIIPGVTLARLGAVLLAICFLLNRAKVSGIALCYSSFFVFMFLFGTIQFLLNGADGSLVRAWSWALFCGIFVIVSSLWAGFDHSRVSASGPPLMVMLGVMAAYPVWFLVVNLGYDWFYEPVWAQRRVLGSMPGGLNRYFLGAYSLASIALCVAFMMRKTKHIMFSLFMLLAIPLVSGSRQFLVVLLVSLLLVVLMGLGKSIRVLLSKRALLLVLVLSGAFSYFFVSGYFDQSLERLIGGEGKHASLDDESARTRIDIYRRAFEYFKANPLGYGPGTAEEMIGMATHSSYVHLTLEFGALGTFAFVLAGAALTFRLICSSASSRRLLLPFFVPYYFLFPLFTDAVYMLVYWVHISVLFGLSLNKSIRSQGLPLPKVALLNT